MQSRFRLFERAGLRCARVLTLTIRADRMWSLSWFAYETLGRARLIKPTFDARTQMLRIAAARIKTKSTFAVHQQGASSFLIAASNVTRGWGIETTTARRYKAILQGGKLLVDLSQVGEVVSRRWGKKEGVPLAAPPAAAVPVEAEAEPAAHPQQSTLHQWTSLPWSCCTFQFWRVWARCENGLNRLSVSRAASAGWLRLPGGTA